MHHLLLHAHLTTLTVHCPTAHRDLSAVIEALLADVASLPATNQDAGINEGRGEPDYIQVYENDDGKVEEWAYAFVVAELEDGEEGDEVGDEEGGEKEDIWIGKRVQLGPMVSRGSPFS